MTIGNWFKTNIQNGNLSKLFGAFGQTAMNAGMASAAMRQMKRQQSIFGNCWGGYGQNYGGCCNNSMMYDPLGIMNYSGGDWFSNYNSQVGIQMAQQMGYSDGLEIAAINQAAKAKAAQQKTGTPISNAKYAGDIDKNQSTKLGKAFDEASTQIVDKDGKPIKGKEIEIVKGGVDKTDKGAAKYKQAVSELGKSFLAEMDQTSGNNDQQLTIDEYVKYEMSHLKSDASDKEKAQAKTMAQNAFHNLDINGDGKLDWKELASSMAVLDADSNGKLDGVITSEEYAKNTENLGQANNTTFRQALSKRYQQLFGQDK